MKRKSVAAVVTAAAMMNAIQEHSDAAHQGEHIKNGHRITRPFSF